MRSIFETAGEPIELALTVNGERRVLTAPPLRRLIDLLREDLGLTGTKEGCGEGECGACTVLVDGEAALACLVPVCQVANASITTIEARGFESIQRAFLVEGGAQCGICTPGMIAMTRAWIDACELAGTSCTADGARAALSGNLCRCTGYEKILSAAVAAARSEARVRREEPRDAGGVRAVNEEAFGRVEEARLVDALRAHAERSISLVAELAPDAPEQRDASEPRDASESRGAPEPRGAREPIIVGHVLFTPVTIEGARAEGERPLRALGLAPLAVARTVQRSGVGSKLVRRGLDLCRTAGVDLVVVLGEPEYYRRFGFERASRFGLACEFEAPDEAFMVAWLAQPADVRGTVRYLPEFASTV